MGIMDQEGDKYGYSTRSEHRGQLAHEQCQEIEVLLLYSKEKVYFGIC